MADAISFIPDVRVLFPKAYYSLVKNREEKSKRKKNAY